SEQRRRAVAGAEIVYLVRRGNLVDQLLDCGIDCVARQRQNVELLNPARIVEVSEDAVARIRCENCGIRLKLLPVPERLIVCIEKQLVFDDTATQRATELVLIEKRLGNSILVIEPGGRGQRVVAVVPVSFAVKFVRPRWRGRGDLGRSAA